MVYTNNANDDAIAVVASSSSKPTSNENDNMNYNTFGSNSSLEQQSLLDNYMPNFGHVHYR